MAGTDKSHTGVKRDLVSCGVRCRWNKDEISEEIKKKVNDARLVLIEVTISPRFKQRNDQGSVAD